MEDLSLPKISSTSVEYMVFALGAVGNDNPKEKLLFELDKIFAFHSRVLVEYIWQNEPFRLSFRPRAGHTPAHLYGCTDFGDYIEDEWFIVWILQSLTKQFQDIVVQVNDGDGEFLLIEAADHLPRWLKPETAKNRVYLYQGEVHIIPLARSPADLVDFPAGELNIEQALDCLTKLPKKTRAADSIQTDILNRLKRFSGTVRSHLQQSHAYLPASLVALLQHRPQLVTPAINAFCQRTPLDLRACRTFQHFRPGERVMASVTMNRCQYAQLRHTTFIPDKRSGYNLPATSSPKHLSYDLGAKIAHGFEILVSSVRDSKKETTGEEPSDTRWLRFVDALQQHGYFKNELQGSRQYQRLLEDARQYFGNVVQGELSGSGESIGSEILRTLKHLEYDLEQMKKAPLTPEDDDSWMQLSEEELQDLMYRSSGLERHQEEKGTASEKVFNQAELGQKVAESMQQFVQSTGALDGAEFPANKKDGNQVDFEAVEFIKSMRRMLDIPEDLPMGQGVRGQIEHGTAEESDSSESLCESDSDEDAQYAAELQRLREDEPSMDDLMQLMDRELGKTELAKSFERVKAAPAARTPAQCTEHERLKDGPSAQQVNTPVRPPRSKPQAKSAPPPRPPPPKVASTRATPPRPAPSTPTGKFSATTNRPLKPLAPPQRPAPMAADEELDSDDDSDEDYRPVDVELNAVKNLLASVSAQSGEAGPAGNILQGMGVVLPPSDTRD